MRDELKVLSRNLSFFVEGKRDCVMFKKDSSPNVSFPGDRKKMRDELKRHVT